MQPYDIIYGPLRAQVFRSLQALFTLIRRQIFVIAAGVAPNPPDIRRGSDPAKGPEWLHFSAYC